MVRGTRDNEGMSRYREEGKGHGIGEPRPLAFSPVPVIVKLRLLVAQLVQNLSALYRYFSVVDS